MPSPAATTYMSSPIMSTPSSPPSPTLASPSPHALTARCGHTISIESITARNSPNVELCTRCELHNAIEHAGEVTTAGDIDPYEGLLAWRKCRLDLANYEYEKDNTDGSSSIYEFTRDQQKKFCRDWASVIVEGEAAEELRAEMEADEAEERAAGSARGVEKDIITTTTHEEHEATKTDDITKVSNVTSVLKPALRQTASSSASSPPIVKIKDSRCVSLITFANTNEDSEPQDHRDESSYRNGTSFHRPAKKQKLYERGRWAPPRSGWLDTSGSGVKDAKWEKDAMDDTRQVEVVLRRGRSRVPKG